MNFWETLVLFFSFQAAILCLLFVVKRDGDKVSNRIFAVFIILFAYNLFYNALYWSRFDLTLYVQLSYTYAIPISLYGSVFYVYIRRVVTGKSINSFDLVHLIPFVLTIGVFGSYYALPFEKKIEVLTAKAIMPFSNIIDWLSPFLVITIFCYGVYSFITFIKKYKGDPELTIWLKAISFSFVAFVGSHIVHRLLVFFSLISPEVDYFITGIMISLIGLVCYFVFTYSSIFNGTPIRKIIPFVKYEKTGLSKEFSEEMRERLLVLMSKERPYLNPEIRLDMIAEMLNVSRHHASQIVNEHFSMSFFEFINHYRIKEAERLLSSYKDNNLSITDIAFQSGFNNRISFYKAFKKKLGTTPTDYRQHHLAS